MLNAIVLTTKEPGLRYRAHLEALQKLGLKVECLGLSKRGLLKVKLKHHLKLLRKKGLRNYFAWQKSRKSGAKYRAQIAADLKKHFQNSSFLKMPINLEQEFSGFSYELVSYINQAKPEFVFQMGVGLVPAEFIKQLKIPILNIHPGILPGIRGLDPIFWAHYYGRADWLGSTLHYIDAGIDTGRPILRRSFKFQAGQTYIDSLIMQIQVEVELLKIFWQFKDRSLSDFDSPASEFQLYRSTWSAKEYGELIARNWWGKS